MNNDGNEVLDEDFDALLNPDSNNEDVEINNSEEKNEKKISESQKNIEFLYAEFEKAKAESKDKQMHAKELKDEIINLMNELGKDEIIINGLDSVVMLSITYPEREVLDRKALAQALGIPQKDLSKPEIIISLTKEGKLTTEMIQKFTVVEERMQFNAQDYDPNES